MLDNENKNVRTDWRTNDVLKPKNMNSLTSSVPYDYISDSDSVNGKTIYELLGSPNPTTKNSVFVLIKSTNEVSPTINISNGGSFFSNLNQGYPVELHIFSSMPVTLSGYMNSWVVIYVHCNEWNKVTLDDTFGSATLVYLGCFDYDDTATYTINKLYYERCYKNVLPSVVGSMEQVGWMSNAPVDGVITSNNPIIIVDTDTTDFNSNLDYFSEMSDDTDFEITNQCATAVPYQEFVRNITISYDDEFYERLPNVIPDLSDPASIGCETWPYGIPRPSVSDPMWSFNWYTISPGNSRKIDWYTWDSYLMSEATSTNPAQYYQNPRDRIYINFDELKERVVYCVELHLMRLPDYWKSVSLAGQAPDYDSANSYSKDDIVLKDDGLIKANKNITAGTSFSSNDWDVVIFKSPDQRYGTMRCTISDKDKGCSRFRVGFMTNDTSTPPRHPLSSSSCMVFPYVWGYASESKYTESQSNLANKSPQLRSPYISFIINEQNVQSPKLTQSGSPYSMSMISYPELSRSKIIFMKLGKRLISLGYGYYYYST